jgi:hypothetical protein
MRAGHTLAIMSAAESEYLTCVANRPFIVCLLKWLETSALNRSDGGGGNVSFRRESGRGALGDHATPFDVDRAIPWQDWPFLRVTGGSSTIAAQTASRLADEEIGAVWRRVVRR